MIARRLILGYIFFGIIAIFCLYIFGIKTFFLFTLGILFYNFVFFVIHRAYATMKGKYKKSFYEYSIIFFYRLSVFVSILLLLFGYFIIHQNYLFPAKLPRYILENNSKQTIIFQTMSHIGSNDFYAQVQENLGEAKTNGYQLIYEGVKPGSEENTKKFNTLLGIQLEANTYQLLSQLYGLQYQNQSVFLGVINNKDYNIDLNIDQIVEIYEKKFPEETIQENQSFSYEINTYLEKILENSNQKELFLLRQYNIALMNFMIKHEALQNKLLTMAGKTNIFSVILDERNAYLAENTLNLKEDKIFIMYGLLHFSGFLEDIQKVDPSWHIIYTNFTQVFTPPVIEYNS